VEDLEIAKSGSLLVIEDASRLKDTGRAIPSL
jgi:hypothetical protein